MGARGIPKIDRLMNLRSFLLASPRPVSIEEIFKQVDGYRQGPRDESGRRLLLRDKRDLEAMGVPIDYVAGGDDEPGSGGYAVDRARYLQPPVPLTPQDAVTLAFLLAAGQSAGPERGRILAPALAKLRRRPGGEGPLPYRFAPPAESLDAGAQKALLSLADACAQRRAVRFRYASPGGPARARRVLPYQMVRLGGAWYLLGLDEARGKIRSFRVSRLRGGVSLLRPRAVAPEYDVPPGFDAREFLPAHPWAFGRGEIDAQVSLDDVAAWRVGQEVDPASLRPAPGGRTLATLRVRDEGAFLRWVAHLGPRARLEGPPRLREAYRAFLRRVRSAHA